MLGRAVDDKESVTESKGKVVSVNMDSGGALAVTPSTGVEACGFCVGDGSLGRFVDVGEELPVHDEPQKFRELGIAAR